MGVSEVGVGDGPGQGDLRGGAGRSNIEGDIEAGLIDEAETGGD